MSLKRTYGASSTICLRDTFVDSVAHFLSNGLVPALSALNGLADVLRLSL